MYRDHVGDNRDTRGQYNRGVDRQIDDAGVSRSIDRGFQVVDKMLSSFGGLVDAVAGTERHVRGAAEELRRPQPQMDAPAASTDTTVATTSWKWSEVIDAETGRKVWLVTNSATGDRAECSSYELAVTIANTLNLKAQADVVRGQQEAAGHGRGERPSRFAANGNGRGAYR